MKNIVKVLTSDKTNFIFLGEAGSGKSEIAINIAKGLVELGEKPVHFFDLDMTKPLFRSRDVRNRIENLGIVFHHQEQFYDAPTLVGGVSKLLKDPGCFVVMDVGGNDIGARAIGGFAPLVKTDTTDVFYVMNPYRPWSDHLEHVDGTLSAILRTSHIPVSKLKLVSNPNNGVTTTVEEIIEGHARLGDMLGSLKEIEFLCAGEGVYEDVQKSSDIQVFPLHLFLRYEWNGDRHEV